MEYKLARTNEEAGYKILKVYEMNGRLYADCRKECERCSGRGEIPYFGHIDKGICFKCAGSKYFYKTFRAYTLEEREKLDAQYQKKQDKKKEELEITSEVNRKTWMEKYGFGDYIFIVTGGNTYNIKDELKAAGARYYAGLGWFFNETTVPAELNIPENFFLYESKFENMFDWNCYSKTAHFKENALNEMKEDIEKIIRSKNKTESKSEFYGVEGERIRKKLATFVSFKVLNSEWGSAYLCTFKIEENIFTWITNSPKIDNLKPGQKIELSGTIKAHTTYMGINQTQLTRCIIKEI